MTYFYSVIWLGIAILLFRIGIKEKKLFKMYAILSLYFIFDAVWWFIRAFTGLDMFHGTLGWVFRGVTLVFIAVAALFYLPMIKKKGNDSEKKK